MYDEFCAGRPDFAFYLPRVMAAQSVLDIGCGTGELLHLAREAGHTGHLCGLDPAPGMLQQARRRSDIDWHEGDLSISHWQNEFDLIVMTGHAFQVWLTDEEIVRSLNAIHRALSTDGHFIFETRNPEAKGWECWTPENASEIVNRAGERVRMAHQITSPFDGKTVSFVITFSSPQWKQPMYSHSTLRFLSAELLTDFFKMTDFVINEQFGNWDKSPLTKMSPEIITSVCKQ